MKRHGNSKKNDRPHHLYEIRDKKDDDVFKYGISDNPIGKDGLSKRIRIQTSFLNLAVGWVRYFAKILVRNIPGRERAQRIEDEFIDSYREKHGRKPRGNIKGGT
ncbi:MAG: hypothetical protein KDD02_00495 [Phaeodactylibacter sp.]|nr:hypothetical protein [Phaeodactylibacter sp.]MCB9299499.1 hypothetical protein [Lewinellaceae bacterium]